MHYNILKHDLILYCDEVKHESMNNGCISQRISCAFEETRLNVAAPAGMMVSWKSGGGERRSCVVCVAVSVFGAY